MIKIYPDLRVSKKSLYLYKRNSTTFFWRFESGYKYSFLNKVFNEIGRYNEQISDLVHNQFQKYIYIDNLSHNEHISYFQLLISLDKNKIKIEEDKILELHLEKVRSIDDLEIFHKFKDIFPKSYNDIIEDSTLEDIIKEIVADEVSNVDDSDSGELISKLEDVALLFEISFTEEIEDLERRAREYDKYLESQEDSYIEDRVRINENLNENKEIEEIFNSLAYKE